MMRTQKATDKQQAFEFAEAPSFVVLLTSSQVEPLYFVQITEKGVAESRLSDIYGHEEKRTLP